MGIGNIFKGIVSGGTSLLPKEYAPIANPIGYGMNKGLEGIYGGGQKSGSPVGGSGYNPTYDPADQIKSIYGSEAEKLAEGTGRYMSGLRGNLDKNVANADIYNQVAGRERGIAKAKAGLSGVDTNAADEQARRNSIYGAAATNEAAKRTALSEYGKGVGNVISGVNRLQQQGEANKIASLPVPVAQENSGGILNTLFGWL